MALLKALFSRQWFLATVLVIAAAAVMARLGYWQLERLSARQAFNASVQEQQDAPVLLLDADSDFSQLAAMEYRRVRVEGNFIPQDEILLRNQNFGGQIGFQLFTPLRIEGSNHMILVQRGWIPEEKAAYAERHIYHVEAAQSIEGILRSPETDFGLRLIPDPTLAPRETQLDVWNNLDFERLSAQTQGPLLDMYLQVLPRGDEDEFPRPLPLQLDLTEGPHLGYAGQWFLFALVLLVGYPIYLKRQLKAAEGVPS